MLIALIVLAVLNLLLSVVVFCSLRVLWARLPEPATNTVGDVAPEDWVAHAKAQQSSPPTLTPEEQAEVAAYRAKWKGVVTDEQSDIEVLALSQLNPS